MALTQSFGIGCPTSILSGTGVIQTFDFENNAYGSNQLNDTAFCGTSSQFNSFSLNIANTTIQFQYVNYPLYYSEY